MIESTVKFDPGIGDLVIDFNNFINELYSQLMSFQTIHQKRARFKLYVKKINQSMQNNVAFYLGCLLWAYYVKNENINNPKMIEGNLFLSLSEDEKDNYDYMIQVNFMENYFDSYERDVLYYTSQKLKVPNEWRIIISLYKEFIEKNSGFINVKTTSDIILPEKLANKKITFDINSIIQTAIEKRDLTIILDVANLVL